ncbi:MAG: ParA family protein [Burkholderiaceae bacterium]
MPVVAVVNRKGGSGKSTLATHLAAYGASNGTSVTVVDVDRQQSMRAWLRERNARSMEQRPVIVGGAVESTSFVRPSSGTDLVVVDTPGGLTGLELARVVMYADAILMPVCNSLFDRESASDCLVELRRLPRVASGRCGLAAIGMRVEPGSDGHLALQRWANERQLALIAALRESATYVRCAEQGLTLFDLPPAVVRPDMTEWQPILDWLRPVLQPPPAVVSANDASIAPLKAVPGPVLRRPETGSRPGVHPRPTQALPARPSGSSVGRLLGALSIPRFLQRSV